MPGRKTNKKTPPKRGVKKTIQKKRTASRPMPAKRTVTRVRQAPTSIGVSVGRSQPSFSGGINRVTVTHRELIGRIDADGTAWQQLARLSLNPGDPTTFPWLAGLAWSWESFTWRRLAFRYEPRCSTTQVGAVQMFTDYDFADNPPASEQIASSYDGFLETAPWTRASTTLNNVGLRQGKAMKFVTPSTGIPSSADPTNYSCGTFFFYAAGTGAVTLGSLWVEYTVELVLPTAGNGVALALGQTASGYTLDTNSIVCPAVPGPSGYSISNFADMFVGASASVFGVPPSKFPAIVFDPTTASWTLPGPAIYQIGASQAFTTATHVAFTYRPLLSDLVDLASTGLQYIVDSVDPSLSGLQDSNSYVLGGIFAVLGTSGVLRLASGGPYTSWGINVDTAGLTRTYTQFLINFISSTAPLLAARGDAPSFATHISDRKLVPHRRECKVRLVVEEKEDEQGEDTVEDIEDLTLPGSAIAHLATAAVVSPPASAAGPPAVSLVSRLQRLRGK